MAAPRLRIEHPVCPACHHVGKIPYGAGLKGFCVGSATKGTAHKKRRMVPVEFTAPAPKDGES